MVLVDEVFELVVVSFDLMGYVCEFYVDDGVFDEFFVEGVMFVCVFDGFFEVDVREVERLDDDVYVFVVEVGYDDVEVLVFFVEEVFDWDFDIFKGDVGGVIGLDVLVVYVVG